MTTLAFALAATIRHDGHGGVADLLSTPEEAAAWLTEHEQLVARVLGSDSDLGRFLHGEIRGSSQRFVGLGGGG